MDLGTGCYRVVLELLTFDEARQECIAIESHLAYITSQEEQDAIGAYLDGLSGKISINTVI